MALTGGHNRRQTAREYVERRLAFHDYDDLADVLQGAEQQLDWAPSRSTFYSWVKAWRDERARDQSGPWSLATDETGRPDIVMRVLAAVYDASKGRLPSLTVQEAVWVVRLAVALPRFQLSNPFFVDPYLLPDPRTDQSWMDPPEQRWQWHPVTLWMWAREYVQAAGDAGKLAALDVQMAWMFAESAGSQGQDPSKGYVLLSHGFAPREGTD